MYLSSSMYISSLDGRKLLLDTPSSQVFWVGAITLPHNYVLKVKVKVILRLTNCFVGDIHLPYKLD